MAIMALTAELPPTVFPIKMGKALLRNDGWGTDVML